ncbi:MAG: hypothetical protein WCJ69_14080 [Betaproteobacteria bacterium]|jgi:hypothetical protein
MRSLEQLAQRKSLLVARADLQRLRLQLTASQVRHLVSPPASASARARLRPGVARWLGLAIAVLGVAKLGRAVRLAGLGLTAYRIVRNWQRPPEG